MNWVYSSLYGQLQFTDSEDSHIVSYSIVSGNVTVTHVGDVWTFTNAVVNGNYLYPNARTYSSSSVVDITFG